MFHIFFSILLLSLSSSADEKQSPLENYLFNSNEEIRTDALIIFHQGKVILDRYARGYHQGTKHISWSLAKTITGLIIANAIDDGYLKLDDKVKKYIKDYKGQATIRNLLEMSSGINFKEEYDHYPVDSDVVKMLYLKGPQVGFGNYVSKLPEQANKVGKVFYYSSGDTNLLMEVLKRVMPKKIYDTYPWDKLFDPLSIKATFEKDSSGAYAGSSYLIMRPKGYLRIAKMIMDGGKWQGERIVPKWYIDEMKTPSTSSSTKHPYSFQIFLNNNKVAYPSLPEDSLIMLGHEGQYVVISHKEQLIAIRLAKDRDGSLERHKFFKLLMNFIGKTEIQNKKIKRVKNSKQVSSFPWLKLGLFLDTLKSYVAKELCTCILVERRTRDQCKNDLTYAVPFFPFTDVDPDGVNAYLVPWSKTHASYVSEKYGCHLY